MYKIFSTTLLASTMIVPVMLGQIMLGQTTVGQTPLDPAKVQQGMKIAPVKLNMQNLDPNMVGYGSYLVNAGGDCNGCHSDGTATQYAKGGNPYFGQNAVVNRPRLGQLARLFQGVAFLKTLLIFGDFRRIKVVA